MIRPNLVRDAIDSYISSVTEERLPDGLFHPSSVSACHRKAIYAARDVTGRLYKTDEDAARLFYIGHRIHEVVQRALESGTAGEAYFECGVEVPAPYNLVGSADALVREVQGVGPYELIEVKSISAGAFKYGGVPYPKHVEQAQMYAWAIQKEGFSEVGFDGSISYHSPVEVAFTRLVYLEKERMDVHEFVLPFTSREFQDIEDKLLTLSVYAEDGTALPPRLPLTAKGYKPAECKRCPYMQQCYRDPAVIEPEVF